MERMTQEEFERRLTLVNCVTNDKYINNITPMKITHLTCGATFIARPMELFHLKDGKCPICQKHRHYSFEDIEALFAESYPEYTIISKSGPNMRVRHDCGTEFDTTLARFKKARIPCPKCSNRNVQRSDEEFKKLVDATVGKEYTFLEPYKNNMTKILVRHNICGNEYMVTPNKFLQLGRRCPYCAGNMKKTLDEVKAEFMKLDPDYEILSEEYINSETPLRILHKTCGREFMMRRTDFIKPHGNRCPHCKNRRSINEELIVDILNRENINYEHPFKISDNRSFDFYLNDLRIMLEYDGEYHYMPIAGNEEKFHNQQNSDKIKEEYCRENGIMLIRIPYWYEENVENIIMKIISGCIPSSSIHIQESIGAKIGFFEE